MAPPTIKPPADLASVLPADLSNFNPGDLIKSEHNSRLYKEIQNLKKRVNDLVEYQIAHPKMEKLVTREEIDNEKKFAQEIEIKKKYIRAEMAVIKTLYRESVMKVREEKEMTAKSRAVNDSLILGLNNLKYEEQSLRSEISAAENYDHKYTKLPLIPVEEFLEKFPEYKGASDHDLMTARIEHEHQVRVKLEEDRREKLKTKQELIAKVKRGKDDLTNLDGMVESFLEAAEPIKKALATDDVGFVGFQEPEPTPKTRPKMSLQERLEKELETAKRDIATFKATATVKEVSKVIMNRFVPVMARVVEAYLSDDTSRPHVYAGVGAQLSEDIKHFFDEKSGDKSSSVEKAASE